MERVPSLPSPQPPAHPTCRASAPGQAIRPAAQTTGAVKRDGGTGAELPCVPETPPLPQSLHWDSPGLPLLPPWLCHFS